MTNSSIYHFSIFFTLSAAGIPTVAVWFLLKRATDIVTAGFAGCGRSGVLPASAAGRLGRPGEKQMLNPIIIYYFDDDKQQYYHFRIFCALDGRNSDRRRMVFG